MSSGLVLGCASVDWRAETRRQLGLKLVDCGTRHELLPCLVLGSTLPRWHDEFRRGGIEWTGALF